MTALGLGLGLPFGNNLSVMSDPQSKFARFTNTAGEYISTPDSAALDITGSIEMVARINPPEWGNPSTLRFICGKWGPTNFSYALFLKSTGRLEFYWTVDGTTGISIASTATLPFGNSITGWVKVEFISNTGTGRSCTFYYASDNGSDVEPTSWTLLEAPTTGAVTSLYSGTQLFQVGRSSNGAAGAAGNGWVGHISRVLVRNGIGGTLVADFRAKDYTSGTSFVSASTGETWTINGAGVVLGPLWKIVFEGDSLTSGTGSTGGNTYPVQAAALLTGPRFGVTIATAGHTLTNMIADLPGQIIPAITSGYPYVAVVVWGGTNDLYAGDEAATVMTRYSDLCTSIRAAGADKIIVGTVLPRSDVGVAAGFETQRQSFNTTLRSTYSNFADALADVAANTTIGDAGDELNITYYNVDQVHMTNTGYGLVASIFAASLTALGII